MQAASNSRNAKVPVPIRTAIGSRPKKPRATIRSLSPGKNPSSANRRLNPADAPESTDAVSDAATETTRAGAPVARSASRTAAAAPAAGAVSSVADVADIGDGRGSSVLYVISMAQLYMRIVPITIRVQSPPGRKSSRRRRSC
jgi:hypothetical protein